MKCGTSIMQDPKIMCTRYIRRNKEQHQEETQTQKTMEETQTQQTIEDEQPATDSNTPLHASEQTTEYSFLQMRRSSTNRMSNQHNPLFKP